MAGPSIAARREFAIRLAPAGQGLAGGRIEAKVRGVANTPEFPLAIAACGASFADADGDLPLALLAKVDWPRFLRLARFHRVQGLMWNALGARRELVPTDTAEALAADAAAIAEANLRSAVECRNLRAAFDAAQIPLLFLKGLTLAALAYGTISIKSAVDIDLLVSETELGRAAEVLRTLGYRLQQPHGASSPRRLERWHRHRKESAWSRAGRTVGVDLHTRLADHPSLIPSVGLGSPKQLVDVAPGIVLPTLGPDALFAYLAVHGASSVWFRLKWAADFAALVHRSTPDEIESRYRRALELGAGRAPAVALLLADTLFGTLREVPALRAELERDRTARWMCAAVLRRLAALGDPIEPTARTLGTLFIHAHQFGLAPGWRFKLSELVRQARASLT